MEEIRSVFLLFMLLCFLIFWGFCLFKEWWMVKAEIIYEKNTIFQWQKSAFPPLLFVVHFTVFFDGFLIVLGRGRNHV